MTLRFATDEILRSTYPFPPDDSPYTWMGTGIRLEELWKLMVDFGFISLDQSSDGPNFETLNIVYQKCVALKNEDKLL